MSAPYYIQVARDDLYRWHVWSPDRVIASKSGTVPSLEEAEAAADEALVELCRRFT